MINRDKIRLTYNKDFNPDDVIELYKMNKWSSAEKPDLLIKALKNSHSLIIAYCEDKLVGLGNAISDGFIVVYYPHLLIHPDFQRQGIGKMIMDIFQKKYENFHQQVLTADGNAVDFYKKCGFEKAGSCLPMWIYKGHDHD
jgi:ribosomal protein S18 acetylase RimI-like enzyme